MLTTTCPESSFHGFIDSLRAGDDRSWEELVDRCEPVLSHWIERHIVRAPMRRVLGAEDICQAVFQRFFERLSAGEFQIASRSALLALLRTMTAHELIDRIRHHGAEMRDAERDVPIGQSSSSKIEIQDPEPSPSSFVANSEILRSFLESLKGTDLTLAVLRLQDASWAEAGRAVQIAPDAARMRVTRAIGRFSADRKAPVARRPAADDVTVLIERA